MKLQKALISKVKNREKHTQHAGVKMAFFQTVNQYNKYR